MNLDELRAVLEHAEKEYAAAERRAEWLKRRMMNAQTDDEFNDLESRLETQETVLKHLGLALVRARYAYTAGELQAQ